MLFIERQAKPLFDDFEEVRGNTQGYEDLVIKFEEVVDSVVNQKEKIIFENQMQKLNESEDKFMFDLVKLYCTANPDTTTTNLDWAVKRKFLVRILPSLQSAIFVSCQDSYTIDIS